MKSSNKQQYWLDRGFTNKTINTHLLGYNGTGFTIPIWEAKPQKSKCLAYKIRNLDTSKPKYVKEGSKEAIIYNHYFCEYAPTILAFAGELDCLAAIQDGYPAFSLVDGKNAHKRLPLDWPNKFFPYVENLLVVFDVGEEIDGAKLAQQWEDSKGKFTSKIFHWPDFDGTDYCDYRLEHNDFDKLIKEYI